MKSFRTVVTPALPSFRLSHHNRILSLGSCFSENIGKKFSNYKFDICVNPFGQQYNPHSVANGLNRLLQPVLYTEKDLSFHLEQYHSFDHHGSFSRNSKEETLQVINEQLQVASSQLKKADVLFLTFATSHVFRLKETGAIVSNCHKFPANIFDRFIMKPVEIIDVLKKPLTEIQKLNKDLKIISTVSPVRYFAFGHYENSVSKAHLFTALYELQQQFPQIYYFPAYELIIDDLRDYRFFSEDMLHPNYEATNYVWDTLCETMMDKSTLNLMKDIDEILQAARHKPRNPNSEAHQQFIRKNLEKAGKITAEYHLDFEQERKIFNSYLASTTL